MNEYILTIIKSGMIAGLTVGAIVALMVMAGMTMNYIRAQGLNPGPGEIAA
jgi:hypothetical protein